MFNALITFFAELDQHLLALVEQHGPLTYAIVFAVLALEVGLVFTPFLPGETLLFAAGALAALDAFNLPLLLVVFSFAAVAGNVSGYTIGRVFHARVGAERRGVQRR